MGVAVNEDFARNQELRDSEFATKFIPLENIRQSSYNPRSTFDKAELQELADSIKAIGLLQPIVVRPLGGEVYEIVAGERRFRACQLAKMSHISAVVRELDEKQARQAAIIENLRRVDINPIDQARGYAELLKVTKEIEPEKTQADVAQELGIKTASTLSNSIRLLDLPEDIQKAIADGKLTQTHGRALLSFNGYKVQAALLNLALAGVNSTAIEKFSDQAIGYQNWQKVCECVEELGSWKCRFEASTECEGCQDRRRRYCLKPECFEEKNKAVLNAQAEEAKKQLEESGSDAVIDLSKVNGNTWAYLSDDLEGCRKDCQHRKTGQTYHGIELVCLDRPCRDRLKKEADERAAERRKLEAETKLAEVLRELDETKYCAGTLQKTTAIALNLFFKQNNEKAVKQAVKDLGLDIDAKKLVDWITGDVNRIEMLAGIHYETQLLFAARTAFHLEAMQHASGATGTNNGLKITKWFLGEPEKGPLYEKMMAEIEAEKAGEAESTEAVIETAAEDKPAQPNILEAVKAEVKVDEQPDIPPISQTIRVGDWIVPRSIEREKKETMAAFDKRIEEAAKEVNHVNVQGDVTLIGCRLILREELNSDWRYYITPAMVRIGDHIADIDPDKVRHYEVINKGANEIRLKPLDGPLQNGTPSHPGWNTLNRYEHAFVKRQGEGS